VPAFDVVLCMSGLYLLTDRGPVGSAESTSCGFVAGSQRGASAVVKE
jgi:hypothetical protein